MKIQFNRSACLLGLLISFCISGCTNYDQVANTEYTKGNYQAAIDDLNKAIKKNPNDDVAYDTLSYVYRDFVAAPNHRDNAYTYANKAIEVCSKNETIKMAYHYGTLADLYRADGNYTEANKYFKKGIDLVPEDFQAQYYYGLSLMSAGNYEAGLTHIRKSLKLNPDYQNAKNTLSRLGR
jgi:tetratricopeptide (TPR) repeat protein